MKINLNQIISRVTCLCLLAGATALHAANGTWTSTAATGNWSDIANWNSGAGPVADGPDAIADFSTLSLVNAVAVTQDLPTGKFIGGMKFGSTGGVFNWTVTASGGTNLNLAVSSGYPTITIATNTATMNLALAGTNGLMIVGPGTLALGATAIYTNNTILTNGATLQEANQYINPANSLLNFYGGTLIAGNSSQFTLPNFFIPAGQTGTVAGFSGSSRYVIGALSGSGTMNLGITCTSAQRSDISGNSAAFAGTVNLFGAGTGRFIIVGGSFAGFGNADVIHNSTTIGVVGNSGGNNIAFGSLAGTNVNAVFNTSSGGSPTWVVGGLNRSTAFAGSFQSGNVVKSGTGTWTLSNNHTYTGTTTINTGAVYGVTGGSISNSVITVATNVAYGASTFGVQVASAGGKWTGNSLVLRSGTALAFNFGTVAPSTTVAPLQLLGGITSTNTVTVNVLGGSGWAAGGVYPLAKYTSAYVGSGFSAFSLGTLPLRVIGVLSNDTANSQIDLVVSAVNQPLKWASSSSNWDLTVSSNWKDATGTFTTYQQQLGLGDQVLFEDTASGASPITVTLNTNVTPASVTFSNVTKDYVLAGISNIVGTTSLTKAGNGNLTIQNTNIFSGAVNINGGTLIFSSLANNLGTGTAINFGGGELEYASGNTADISTRTVTIGSGGAIIDTAGNNVAFAKRIGNNGAGGLTKTGAGTLTLTNSTYTGVTLVDQGTLALSANASLSNSAAIVVNSGATLDASGTGFGFNLNGAISQILAGSGVVTGSVTTAVNTILTPGTNGTVSTLTFNSDLNLAGGTYYFDVGTTSHDLIQVGSAGALNLTGGTLTINPLNSLTNGVYKLIQYAGGYNSGAGSVLVAGSQPNKIFTLLDTTPGEIDLFVTSSATNNLVWKDYNVNEFWNIDTDTNWLDTFTASPAMFDNGDTLTFDDTGLVNSPNVAIQAPVAPASVLVGAAGNYTFTGSKITGAASLTKTNTGTLTLANAGNDYSGVTVIKNGILQVGDGSTGGTSIGSGNITNNASLIFYQPDNSTVQGNVSGTGSLTEMSPSPTATLTLLGNNTYSGATTVDTGVLQIGNGGVSGTLSPAAVTLANGGTLDLNHSGIYTLANGISGNGTLKFDGAATVTYGGANSYLNNTYINNGTVKLSAANVIPAGGLTTGWLVLDGGPSTAGALDLNGFNQSVNALAGLGGTVQGRIYNNGSGLNTLTLGNLSTTTYAGLILNNTNGGSGSVGLTVNGDGSLVTTLTLSGANSFTGPVYIDGASVIMAGSLTTVGQSSIGAGPITLTNNGTLAMNGLGNVGTSTSFGNSILVPAGATGNLKTGGRTTYYGSLTVHGTLNLTTSYVRSSPTGNWSASDGQINIIAGLNGGDVYLNNAGNINWGTAAIDLGAGTHIYNSANNGGPINITIGELTGSGTISDTTAAGPTSRTTIYVVGGRNTDATFSGTIANQARWTGINKVGTGKWTLAGTDSYSGPTTVSSGSLIVGAASFMTTSTPITVNSDAVFDVSSYGGLALSAGQTLAGAGVITGAVTLVASDLVSPGVGTAPGTLSFSNSLTETGDFVTNNFNLSSDPTGLSKTNSQVIVAGDLTLTGTNIVIINPLNTVLGAGTYTLFTYSGALITNGVAAVGGTLENNFVAGGAFAANSAVTLTFSNAPGAVVMIVTPNGQNLVWQGGITGTITNNWDVNVSSNWLAGVTVNNFLQYDNVTFDDSATNLNAIVAGTLAPGAITVGSTNAYTFSGSGKLTGPTGIIKTGTNVLTISNTGGNDYTGTVSISGGTLKTGTGTALGAVNSAVVANGGTLDLNGQTFTNRSATISVQGAGYNGEGAIVNSGAQLVNNGLSKVTLTDDATFGGTNRWDIINGTLTGNNHNLTKVGSSTIVLTRLADIGVSNINVQVGQITLIGDTTLGLNSGKLTLWPGSALDLYSTTVTNTKPVSMTNAAISSSNLTNVYGGTLTLNGTNMLTATTPLQLNGALGGSGGVLKLGASTLTLAVAETYTGNTTISNGVIALVAPASIATSTNIDLAAATARLDVTGLAGGSVTLGSAQTLKGIGAVIGSVTAPAGSTVSPGESGIGTLTVTNTITLGGTTMMEVNHDVVPTRDQIVATNIVFGGTLTVVNTGTPLVLGDFFKLFAGGYSGVFAVTNLPALASGLVWANTLAANGTIAVVASPVNTTPTNVTATVVGNVLQLAWPVDHTGWHLQIQTNNLAGGVSANTNDWFTIAGSELVNSNNITMDPAKPMEYYRLVYP